MLPTQKYLYVADICIKHALSLQHYKLCVPKYALANIRTVGD